MQNVDGANLLSGIVLRDGGDGKKLEESRLNPRRHVTVSHDGVRLLLRLEPLGLVTTREAELPRLIAANSRVGLGVGWA